MFKANIESKLIVNQRGSSESRSAQYKGTYIFFLEIH
jgi:hypothetical protein